MQTHTRPAMRESLRRRTSVTPVSAIGGSYIQMHHDKALSPAVHQAPGLGLPSRASTSPAAGCACGWVVGS